MEAIWLYQRQGEGGKLSTAGPVTSQEIQELVREGLVTRNTLVRNKKDATWSSLALIDGLSHIDFSLLIRQDSQSQRRRQ